MPCMSIPDGVSSMFSVDGDKLRASLPYGKRDVDIIHTIAGQTVDLVNDHIVDVSLALEAFEHVL